jgi:hypothetical protein
MDDGALGGRATEMLELFELGRWEHELVESFSHGMKQRLVMSAAFLHRPKAVLVDEPMVGLDPRGARLIKDVFRRMAEHGVAILMSTHTLEVAQEMCDRIAIILKGQIIARGTVADVKTLAGGSDSASDRGVPATHRRLRPPGNRRSVMTPRASEAKRATRTERAGGAVSERACRGVRGAKPSEENDAALSLPAAAVVLGLAQPRAPARARGRHARHVLRARRRRRRRCDLQRVVLADGATGGFADFGDYLLRLGLSWLFLSFLSFLAFSGIVTRCPRSSSRTICGCCWRHRSRQSGCFTRGSRGRSGCRRGWCWSSSSRCWRRRRRPLCAVVVLLAADPGGRPVRDHPGRDRDRDHAAAGECLPGAARPGHPDADGTAVRRQPGRPAADDSAEQLLRVESLPDLTDFFATLQSPITPLLPSFWVAEAVFASLQGRFDGLHMAALWTTALGLVVLVAAANERWHFTGFSKAQEARKAKFTRFELLTGAARLLPLAPVRRHMLIKDLKIFLRDVSQWSQLLLLLALVMVYLYNFRVLDLDRNPYMSGVIKNAYAFVNLAMAGLVMSTVCARFVFPAVSSEGAAFWIIRTAPVSLRTFLGPSSGSASSRSSCSPKY